MRALRASLAIIAFSLATPAVASSDGTLGPTSNGTFTVSVAISPTAIDNVRVYGLDDMSFSGTEGQTIDSSGQQFCITRETGGQIGLTISSFDAADTYYRVKKAGGADEVQMLFHVFPWVGTDAAMVEGAEQVFDASDVCTEGNSGFFNLSVSLLNTATAVAGNYSNSFLVTVAPK